MIDGRVLIGSGTAAPPSALPRRCGNPGSPNTCGSNRVSEMAYLPSAAWGENPHHDLPRVDRQIGVVEAPVKLLLRHGLVGRVVVRRQVLVGQRLLRRYPLLGVEDEHPFQQVDGCTPGQHLLGQPTKKQSMKRTRRIGVLELVLERLPLALGKGLDESQRLERRVSTRRVKALAGQTHVLARDGVDNIIRRCSQEFRDDGELVDVVLAGEQRLALEHLGKDAACAPDIDFDVVLLPRKHDLRGAVVPRRNVARHLGVLNPRQAKIADLQITILVDQDVTWL